VHWRAAFDLTRRSPYRPDDEGATDRRCLRKKYDRRIQFIGGGPPHDEIVIVDGSLADRRLTALYRRGDRLVACLALNQPRALLKYRMLLAAGES
jgi:hypothetical protein